MKLVRFGICALVAFGVAAHGGVEDWARAVLETGAGLLFLVWAVLFFISDDQEKQVVVTPLLPPLVALAFVALGQLLFRATASTYSTRMELNLLVADCIVLFLAAQVFRTSDDWQTFIWFVMGFGFLVTIFGILQQLTFNGKLYWFREMRYGGIPFGPYVNRNHFAGFVELVVPGRADSAGARQSPKRALDRRRHLRAAAHRRAVSVRVPRRSDQLWRAAGRADPDDDSASRRRKACPGGWTGHSSRRFCWSPGSASGRFSTASHPCNLWKLPPASALRCARTHGESFSIIDGPARAWAPFRRCFPAYETLYDGKIVNHSHNDYLEALAETGIAGGVCCARLPRRSVFLSLSLACSRWTSPLPPPCTFRARGLCWFLSTQLRRFQPSYTR